MKTMQVFRFRGVLLASICGLLVRSSCTTLGVDLDPVLVGQWPKASDLIREIRSVAVSGNHVFLACGNAGLQIFDVSNPMRPERVSRHSGGGGAVAVSGDYAYVGPASEGALEVIDIRDPVHPQRVGMVEMVPNFSGMGTTEIVIAGGHAYVAGGQDSTVNIFDVADPTNPHLVGEFPAVGSGLAVIGNYGYLAGEARLLVFDLSTPAKPRQVGGCRVDGSARRVTVLGQYAYLASAGIWNGSEFVGGGLQIVDLTDSTRPALVGALETLGHAAAVAVAGHYAFVALERFNWVNDRPVAGLELIDVSDPSNPLRASTYDTGRSATAVAINGNSCYLANNLVVWNPVAGFLDVIDFSDPTRPQLQGGIGDGPVEDVAVSGQYAYVADREAGLQILDISDPTDPQRVGQYYAGRNTRAVAVSGGLACVAAGNRLHMVDIATPTNPRVLARYGAVWESAEDVALSGRYAFVAGGEAGLVIIDISDPSTPRYVGNCRELGAKKVAVGGNYAYVTDPFGLLVVDIANPAQPRAVGGYAVRGPVTDLAVSGSYVYLASPDAGLQVIDVRDPASPQRVSRAGRGQAVAVSGSLACVAGGDRGLKLIDISHPSTLQDIGGLPVAGYARAVALSDAFAYVGEGDEFVRGLRVINLARQANPQRAGGAATIGNSRDVVVAGRYAYVTTDDGLEVIDISSPTNPERIAGVRFAGSAGHVAVSGNHVLVALPGYHDGTNQVGAGLQIVDVTNPKYPRQVGAWLTSGPASDVALAGDYAYLTELWYVDGRARGRLHVIDISNPADPQRVNGMETGGWTSGVSISGPHLYVADGSAGLHVIDISSPANPRQVSSLEVYPSEDLTENIWLDAQDVAVSGDYAYVVTGNGVRVIDVSTPASPRHVAGFNSGAYARSVAVFGRYAYLTGNGLQVIDISDPRRLVRVGGNTSFDFANAVALADGKIYVASDNYAPGARGGVVVLEMQPFFKQSSLIAGQLHLTWEGWGQTRLEAATDLRNPNWRELQAPSTNSVTVPAGLENAFFRLRKL